MRSLVIALLLPSVALADPALRAQHRIALTAGAEFVPVANQADTGGGVAGVVVLHALVNVVPSFAIEADAGSVILSSEASLGVRVYPRTHGGTYVYAHAGVGENSHVVFGTGQTESWDRTFVAGGVGHELVLGAFVVDGRLGVGASDGHVAPDLALTLGARL